LTETRAENGFLLAAFFVELDVTGRLKSYKKLESDDVIKSLSKRTDGRIWYAYMEYAAPSAWFNNQTYVDTLNKDAMEEFIKTTHEKYYNIVGHEFGKSIPAIFCDEP
jgi:hypothetical protein